MYRNWPDITFEQGIVIPGSRNSLFKKPYEDLIHDLLQERTEYHNRYEKKDDYIYIEKAIFNEPATIVFWSDGTKTVVKCCENDIYDPEKGLAMAICKYVLGDNFHKTFKKHLPKEDDYILLKGSVPFESFADILKGTINRIFSPTTQEEENQE